MQKNQDKSTRLMAIRMIVSSQQLESQDELLAELDKAGCPCGQATLSRDLRKLRISKIRLRNGRSVYSMSKEGMFSPAPSREELNREKWAIQFSGNLMVIHTPPGHASMVAYRIDNAHSTMLLGTVAGDDTILVVLAETATRDEVISTLREYLPELRNKILY